MTDAIRRAAAPWSTGLRSGFAWMLHDRRAGWRRAAGWCVTAIMILVIGWQLHAIGWTQVWRARPTEPAFYLLFLASYLVLPVMDVLIFRHLWRIGFADSLGAFLRKRVLNSAFIGYSGEVFLLIWARARLTMGDARLAHDIKDSNILSAAVSTWVTAALILHVLFNGGWRQLDSTSFDVWAMITIAMAALMPAAVLLRKLVVLPLATTAWVLAMHTARFAMVQALTLAQWHVVMPDTSWNALVTLLTAQLLVSRIPLVPNRDMLFIGVAIAISGPLAMAPARIASLMIVTNALQLALHLLVLVLTAPRGRAGDGATPA